MAGTRKKFHRRRKLTQKNFSFMSEGRGLVLALLLLAIPPVSAISGLHANPKHLAFLNPCRYLQRASAPEGLTAAQSWRLRTLGAVPLMMRSDDAKPGEKALRRKEPKMSAEDNNFLIPKTTGGECGNHTACPHLSFSRCRSHSVKVNAH